MEGALGGREGGGLVESTSLTGTIAKYDILQHIIKKTKPGQNKQRI